MKSKINRSAISFKLAERPTLFLWQHSAPNALHLHNTSICGLEKWINGQWNSQVDGSDGPKIHSATHPESSLEVTSPLASIHRGEILCSLVLTKHRHIKGVDIRELISSAIQQNNSTAATHLNSFLLCREVWLMVLVHERTWNLPRIKHTERMAKNNKIFHVAILSESLCCARSASVKGPGLGLLKHYPFRWNGYPSSTKCHGMYHRVRESNFLLNYKDIQRCSFRNAYPCVVMVVYPALLGWLGGEN